MHKDLYSDFVNSLDFMPKTAMFKLFQKIRWEKPKIPDKNTRRFPLTFRIFSHETVSYVLFVPSFRMPHIISIATIL